MTDPVALDTSLAVPLLATTHDFHDRVDRWLDDRPAVLSGHAVAETYSVLTRLHGEIGRSPAEAAALIESWFGLPALISDSTLQALPRVLAEAGIGGGAVYDALVGLASREHGLTLGTRDARARRTYDALGVRVEFVT